jgi:hypothetical protein
MGLQITSPLHTNKGDTSTMYLNINHIMLPKDGNNQISIKRYMSEAIRITNQNDTCECYEVKNTFKVTLTVTELAAANIYVVVYGKIKAELMAAGLIVVDAI